MRKVTDQMAYKQFREKIFDQQRLLAVPFYDEGDFDILRTANGAANGMTREDREMLPPEWRGQ